MCCVWYFCVGDRGQYLARGCAYDQWLGIGWSGSSHSPPMAAGVVSQLDPFASQLETRGLLPPSRGHTIFLFFSDHSIATYYYCIVMNCLGLSTTRHAQRRHQLYVIHPFLISAILLHFHVSNRYRGKEKAIENRYRGKEKAIAKFRD